MLIPVEISSFAIEPKKITPLVVLKETGGGSRTVAIPLEAAEANVIAMHSIQVSANKPSTIDLVRIAVQQLGGALYRSVINDVTGNDVFSACIIIRAASALKVIDCRPSDAIILALKCEAPMFVREDVFCKLDSERGQSETELLRAHIRSIDVMDFGKYVLE